MRPSSEGGVEEKKDDGLLLPSPMNVRKETPRTDVISDAAQYSPAINEGETHDRSFRDHCEDFARAIFGSCGSAMEAASFFLQNQGCKWPSGGDVSPGKNSKPPLSIAEELGKLAMQEGRYPPDGFKAERPADIPKFLGEHAVKSFEDDNISAISANTLEEMARKGIVHPYCQGQTSIQSNSSTPPSPTRTTSLSTNSSKERKKEEGQRMEV